MPQLQKKILQKEQEAKKKKKKKKRAPNLLKTLDLPY